MKNTFIICLFILGIFLAEPCFAAKRKCIQCSNRVTPSGNIASFEAYCHNEINKVREEHCLRPLTWWPQLSDCAREHSQNMAYGKCPFGHHGFKNRANQMQKVAKISSFGENVAYSYNYEDPVKIAVESWMKSDGHRKNILGDFEETGIGVAITKEGKFYITQLFAQR